MWLQIVDENRNRVALGKATLGTRYFEGVVQARGTQFFYFTYNSEQHGELNVELKDALAAAEKGGDPPFQCVDLTGLPALTIVLHASIQTQEPRTARARAQSTGKRARQPPRDKGTDRRMMQMLEDFRTEVIECCWPLTELDTAGFVYNRASKVPYDSVRYGGVILVPLSLEGGKNREGFVSVLSACKLMQMKAFRLLVGDDEPTSNDTLEDTMHKIFKQLSK
eukprot:1155421-Pelagomonas_calceolata.AAC.3